MRICINQASHSEIDRLGTLQKKKGCVKDNSDLTCITNLILRSDSIANVQSRMDDENVVDRSVAYRSSVSRVCFRIAGRLCKNTVSKIYVGP